MQLTTSWLWQHKGWESWAVACDWVSVWHNSCSQHGWTTDTPLRPSIEGKQIQMVSKTHLNTPELLGGFSQWSTLIAEIHVLKQMPLFTCSLNATNGIASLPFHSLIHQIDLIEALKHSKEQMITTSIYTEWMQVTRSSSTLSAQDVPASSPSLSQDLNHGATGS